MRCAAGRRAPARRELTNCRWLDRCGSRLRAAWLTFGDFPQVVHREDDPPAVEVERNLLAVSARSERALGDLGQAELP